MQDRRKVAYRHARTSRCHHWLPAVTAHNHTYHIHYVEESLKENPEALSSHTKKPFFKISAAGFSFGHKKQKKSTSNQSNHQKTTASATGSSKKKKHGKHYALKMLLLKLVIVACIFWFVFTYVFGITILYGNYMYPSVRDGDLVITYKLQSPIINDLVMYEQNGEKRIARVVAKENAVIKFNSETETYTVNGVVPSESIFYTTVENEASGIEYPYTVPANCLYVLNDHREDTTDSRTYEAISMNDVQGVVVFVIRRRGF